MFAILDSNVWISDIGLKSAQGETAKRLLQAKAAVLVIPDVVRQEVQNKLCEMAVKEKIDIRNSHGYLQRLLGDIDDITLPTDERIKQCVSGLFENSGLETREIPLTLESAKSSYEKILNKLAPSDKNEQFKDGVIWANSIELLSESDVWLVSKDKAFFKNRNENEGLASNLLEESSQRPNELRLFYGLERLVDPDVVRVSPDG